MACCKFILLLLYVSLGMCVNRHEDVAWEKHNELASEKFFPCSEPQPRVFYLEDLIDKIEWTAKYESKKATIQPIATILHRCESAGYCQGSNQRCLPSYEQNITLTFAFVAGRIDYFPVKVLNHTECACQTICDKDIK